MKNNIHISRRSVLKTGVMSVAAGAAAAGPAHAYMPGEVKPKAPGKTKKSNIPGKGGGCPFLFF